MFDKGSVTINENPYFFAAYPPRIPQDQDATIALTIKNTTRQLQSTQIRWRLYRWDSMNPENFIREFTTTTLMQPRSSENITFVIPEKEEPVYYLVGELAYQDTKSIVNIRFVREGVDKVRLNFPSITSYPLQKDIPTILFTCLHNSGQSAQVQNNKLVLEVINKKGKIMESYEYS